MYPHVAAANIRDTLRTVQNNMNPGTSVKMRLGVVVHSQVPALNSGVVRQPVTRERNMAEQEETSRSALRSLFAGGMSSSARCKVRE